ncbi:vgr related protein [Sphingobium cloacae]|uniref:Vgr related protein n=1 Tax=Sphingobium cloacae TaxID=120107 RepID=A0A1E1F1A9_9SPHN|nr:vgr related protein [Sphingobium cloacae]BAV64241.1 hypothetical protein SCLO_1012010 [Sphingobium cloacae]
MTARLLTRGEIALARSIYHDSIDLSVVEVRRRKWFPFQPRRTVMAPTGHIHFHPACPFWCEDFSRADLMLRGLFLHELCHVWQSQSGIFLPIRRHPFCRYSYSLKPGLRLPQYGLEQQAEIVRHAYLLREGAVVPGAPELEQYESLLAIFR